MSSKTRRRSRGMETLTSLHDALTKRTLALQAQGRSPRTVDWYVESLYAFALYLSQDERKKPVNSDLKRPVRIEALLKAIPFSGLNLENVRSWVISQRHATAQRNHPYEALQNRKKPLSMSTINSRIRCLRALSNWLHEKGYASRPVLDGLDIPKTEERDPEIVEVETVKRLLDSIDEKRPMGLRDKVVIWLLYDLGLRVSELANLKVADVHLSKAESYIEVIGKGRKWRPLKISQDAAYLLDRFFSKDRFRPEPAYEEYVFIASTGTNLTVKGIQTMLRRRCQRAGIRPINPHLLRHSNATLFMERFGSELLLKARLGHSSLKVTSRYAHIASRRSMLKQDAFSLLTDASINARGSSRSRRNREKEQSPLALMR